MAVGQRHSGDPRFASFPSEPGVGQLRWYVAQTAAGVLSIQELLADFRGLHEASERLGHTQFANPAEARAVWDVLWAVEFCVPKADQQLDPADYYSPEQVLEIVQRTAVRLAR